MSTSARRPTIAARRPPTKACVAGEGATPLASVWAFTPPASGIFPALKPGDPNPPHEIFARGLRNSMALAVHPQFPDAGYAFMQGENGRDLPDIFKPNEEINALEKGRHYGWPYCYDLTTASPEYKAFLQTRTPYQNLCTNNAIYKQPYSLLPPHAAPLGMFYYQGDKFPGVERQAVVGLHGYRPTGSRVIFYDVDAKGFPVISPAPVHYNVSCAAEPTRAFQTEQEPRGSRRGVQRTDFGLASRQRRAAARRAGRHDGRRRRRDLAGRGQEPDHPAHRCRADDRTDRRRCPATQRARRRSTSSSRSVAKDAGQSCAAYDVPRPGGREALHGLPCRLRSQGRT